MMESIRPCPALVSWQSMQTTAESKPAHFIITVVRIQHNLPQTQVTASGSSKGHWGHFLLLVTLSDLK